MQTVDLISTKWASIKTGDSIFWNGERAEVQEATTTTRGHCRVTVNGQTHTMSRGGQVVKIQPRD